jgi:protease-4
MRQSRVLKWALPALLVAGRLAAAAAPANPVRPAEQPVTYALVEVPDALREARPPLFLFQGEEETLRELLGRLDRARRDKDVTGLIVEVGDLTAGWAKVQELRQALLRWRTDGKPVICVLRGGGNLAYYLATASQRIIMPPAGSLMLVGLRAEAVFAKGLLDRIGVKAEFVQAGRYKSAAETLTREAPSKAFVEMTQELLEDLHGQLIGGIVQGRALSVSRAAALVRAGPYTAAGAREAGLVDGIAYLDEVLRDLEQQHGRPVVLARDYGKPRREGLGLAGPAALLSLLMARGPEGMPRPGGAAIAVIYAVGPIVEAEAGPWAFGEDFVAADALVGTIRKAAADDNVKAIVLRVDSPGGSAEACDAVWHELRLADARKPVIASLSDVAASGGYYLAAGARTIYAEPGCLTGSIGVIGGKISVGGLMEKLGLKVFVMERGGQTGMDSLLTELTARERDKLQELVDDAYRTFLDRVAQTRPGMDARDVDKVAQGRVWSAQQAGARGLVDKLGGIEDALAAAREAAGIPPGADVAIIELPKPRSLLDAVLFGRREDSAGLMDMSLGAAVGLPQWVRPYWAALWSLQEEPAMCLLPAAIRIR